MSALQAVVAFLASVGIIFILLVVGALIYASVKKDES